MMSSPITSKSQNSTIFSTPLKLLRSMSKYNQDEYKMLESISNLKKWTECESEKMIFPQHPAKQKKTQNSIVDENFIHLLHQNFIAFIDNPSTSKGGKFIIRCCQIPSQIKTLYQEETQRKIKVNFKQGYLHTLGYLFYCVEKHLFLINPNQSLFPSLSPLVKVQLPDIVVALKETEMKIKIEVGGKNQTGTLMIIMYPWSIELYAIVKSEIKNPIFKLYVKYNLEVETVVGIEVDQQGYIYYVGKDCIIRCFNINGQIDPRSKAFSILRGMKKSPNPTLMNLIDRFRNKLIIQFKQLSPLALVGWSGSLFLLVEKWNKKQSKRQTVINEYKANGEQIKKGQQITHYEICHRLSLPQRNIVAIGTNSANVVIILENNVIVEWKPSTRQFVILWKGESPPIKGWKIASNKVGILTSKGLQLIEQRNRTLIEGGEVGIQNYLDWLQGKQSYYIHQTDQGYRQIVQLNPYDEICNETNPQIHGLMPFESIINRVRGICPNDEMLASSLLLIMGSTSSYNAQLQTQILKKPITIPHQQFLWSLLEVIINDFNIHNQQFTNFKVQLSSMKRGKDTPPAPWIWTTICSLSTLLKPLWNISCRDQFPFQQINQQIKSLMSLLEEKASFIHKIFLPFVNKILSYVCLMHSLPSWKVQFGEGFTKDVDEFQSQLFTQYVTNYDNELLERWKKYFPIYLTEQLMELCQLYEKISTATKLQSLMKLQAYPFEEYPSYFLTYLWEEKGISEEELKEVGETN